jgi:hypothetical protein
VKLSGSRDGAHELTSSPTREAKSPSDTSSVHWPGDCHRIDSSQASTYTFLSNTTTTARSLASLFPVMPTGFGGLTGPQLRLAAREHWSSTHTRPLASGARPVATHSRPSAAPECAPPPARSLEPVAPEALEDVGVDSPGVQEPSHVRAPTATC